MIHAMRKPYFVSSNLKPVPRRDCNGISRTSSSLTRQPSLLLKVQEEATYSNVEGVLVEYPKMHRALLPTASSQVDTSSLQPGRLIGHAVSQCLVGVMQQRVRPVRMRHGAAWMLQPCSPSKSLLPGELEHNLAPLHHR